MKILTSIKPFYMKCKRVWLVLKKPSKQEFEKIIKVSGVGILLLGALGFLVSIIMKLFVK